MLRPVARRALDLAHRAQAITIDHAQLRADRVGIRCWAHDAHAQAGPGTAIPEEARRGAVLRHHEIEPAVGIVVGVCRTALIAVHGDPGAPVAQWQQSTRAVAQHQEAEPRIRARKTHHCLRKILSEKNVLVPVAIEICNVDRKSRCELRIARQRHRVEMVAAVEKRHVVKCDGAEPGRFRQVRTEHLLHRRVRKRRKTVDSAREVRHGHAQARVAHERREATDARVTSREEHLLLVCSAERTVHERQRARAVGLHRGVAAPARRDDIETPVAIEIASRDSVPAAAPPAEPPGIRCAPKAAVPVIEEQQHGIPLASHQQVRVTIAVDIREQRRRHHSHVTQQR